MEKTKFDLIICDVTTPAPYETRTLVQRGLGGTEATVIRVAEGLAGHGLKVAIMQHGLNDVLMGDKAYYIPTSMVDEVDCEYYIALRGLQFIDKFRYAQKYTWHQDVADHRIAKMRDQILKHNVTVVGVSNWHKQELQRVLCDKDKIDNPKVTFVYNPVPDGIYVPKNIEVKYNPNKLVWPASPHKGLNKAIEFAKNLREVSGNFDFKLHIFNPGYYDMPHDAHDFLINHGPVPCFELWQHVSEALCVFYPTQFDETFGCIAAEANAVHTPILTCARAGLLETVSSERQYAKYEPKSVIDTAIKWYNGERPKVWGQDRFKLSNVLKDWARLFDQGC